MVFNRSVLAAIENALKKGKSKVPLNGIWKGLNETYGVGQRIGATSSLELRSSDYSLLRVLVKQNTGLDVLDQDGSISLSTAREADRMTLAQHIPNEKTFGVRVAADKVLVSSVTGRLTLSDGEYRIPAGSALSCHYSQLQGLKQVVLVENLAPMYALDRYAFPDELVDVPMLYRGSPHHLVEAVTQGLEGVDQVICFPDYDPRGLLNSLTQKKGVGLIVPHGTTIDALIGARLTKHDDFDRQSAERTWLQANARHYQFVDRMLSDRLALSQEAMAGYPLRLEGLARN